MMMQSIGTAPPLVIPPVPPQPMDMRFGYRNVRYNSSDRDREIGQWRSENSWGHQKPFSVLVCAMGAHWKPGSWQRVSDMIHFANVQGFQVNFEELMDRCFNPYDAIGAMRNEAIMRARQGYEYLLYVDNDVLPPKDMLLRLLRWQVPIVAPYVREPGTGKPLHGPHRVLGEGLQPVRWAVLSMLLFQVSVFNAFPGGEFWNSAIGADEGYHFQKLWDVAHRPMLDTDQELEVYSIPTYPLATNRMTEQEAKSFWDKRRDWLLSPPDRGPIDPNDPRQRNGEYLPFVAPASTALTGAPGWSMGGTI